MPNDWQTNLLVFLIILSILSIFYLIIEKLGNDIVIKSGVGPSIPDMGGYQSTCIFVFLKPRTFLYFFQIGSIFRIFIENLFYQHY